VVREEEAGVFKLFVWVANLQNLVGDEEKLNPEDRAARKRLLKLQREAAEVPREKLEEFLNERMRQEIAQVTPEQMSRFLREQLVGRGSLEATQVRLADSGPGILRFAIEARPREGAYRSWPHTLTFLFGAVPTEWHTALGPMVYGVEDTLVGSIGAGVTMLLATIITAFFIPNMLRKGTVDLLLAKPIRRSILLIYKFIGGLTFMFLNTVVVVVGIWLVLGLRSGLWAPGFLLVIFILTFEFAIFYAVSTLFGVLTRSPIVSILAACFTWVVLWVSGLAYAFVDLTRELKPFPQWVYVTVDTAHFVLPRYKDLDILTSKLLARDLLAPDSFERQMQEKTFTSINWGESVGFTVGFIAVMVGLACWRFATKDY
jgi:ABC-type transport system involved in multi-copper enzyme maturation permease subunit